MAKTLHSRHISSQLIHWVSLWCNDRLLGHITSAKKQNTYKPQPKLRRWWRDEWMSCWLTPQLISAPYYQTQSQFLLKSITKIDVYSCTCLAKAQTERRRLLSPFDERLTCKGHSADLKLFSIPLLFPAKRRRSSTATVVNSNSLFQLLHQQTSAIWWRLYVLLSYSWCVPNTSKLIKSLSIITTTTSATIHRTNRIALLPKEQHSKSIECNCCR